MTSQNNILQVFSHQQNLTTFSLCLRSLLRSADRNTGKMASVSIYTMCIDEAFQGIGKWMWTLSGRRRVSLAAGESSSQDDVEEVGTEGSRRGFWNKQYVGLYWYSVWTAIWFYENYSGARGRKNLSTVDVKKFKV